MDVKRSAVAMAVGLSVAACAPMSTQGGGTFRTGANQVCKGVGVECQVHVTCASGKCAADPEVLLIDKGELGQKLKFMLTEPPTGYAFPANAIVFQLPGGAATSDWTCTTNGPAIVNCVAVKYSKGTIYEYVGKVIGPDGPDHPVNVDPWVVNN